MSGEEVRQKKMIWGKYACLTGPSRLRATAWSIADSETSTKDKICIEKKDNVEMRKQNALGHGIHLAWLAIAKQSHAMSPIAPARRKDTDFRQNIYERVFSNSTISLKSLANFAASDFVTRGKGLRAMPP